MLKALQSEHTKVVRRLLIAIVAVLLFVFFGLVPLYDTFCRLTGINGKVSRTGELKEEMIVDQDRLVKVQLVSIHNDGMPWQFEPMDAVVKVNPGQPMQTAFIAMNPTDRTMRAQAIPSIAPAEAAAYVQKINCFCFNSQELVSQARIEMPMVFVVDSKLPAYIRTITISYTLFDITTQDEKEAQQKTSSGTPTESREMLL